MRPVVQAWLEQQCQDYDPQDCVPDVVIFARRSSVVRRRTGLLCGCGRVLPAGAHYERSVGKSDGKFFSAVQCAGPSTCWKYEP